METTFKEFRAYNYHITGEGVLKRGKAYALKHSELMKRLANL